MTPSVRVRCAKCRKVLRVGTAESILSGEVFEFRRCMKCDIPKPRDIIAVLIQTNRPAIHLVAGIEYEQMMAALKLSRERNKPADLDVRVADDGTS